MTDIDWQFHFRNFRNNNDKMKIRCHHAGCAMTKWHDGRPCCWKGNVSYSPTGNGATEDVYAPSGFVVNFGDWWPLIKDGLKLIKDIGVYFVPPKKPSEMRQILADIFALEVDIIKEVIEEDGMTDDDFNELMESAQKSFEQTCTNNNMKPERVKEIARQMGLADNEWALLAGKDYWDNIHGTGDGGSPIVGEHGWSMFRGPDGDRKIATACFLHKGHFIYAVDWKNDIDNYFWSSQINGEWQCP